MGLRLPAAIGALMVVGSASAAAAVAPSHARLFSNRANTVACGLMIAPKEILCSAEGVPAPPHTNENEGDPGFVEIAAGGAPVLLRLSEDSFLGAKAVTLGPGASWTGRGVTCTIAAGKTVRCANGAGHGFVIGNGHYKSF